MFPIYRLIMPLFITLLLGPALIGCQGGPDGFSSPAREDEALAVADFNITLYQGQSDLGAEEVMLSDLEGKPVVINYWAGLCPPCRAEMPEFQEFKDEYEGRVTLVGVDLGQFLGLGTREHAQKLLADLGVSYPAGFTHDGTVVESHRVLGLPTTIFVAADGTLHRKWDGILNKAKLSELANEMLAAQER